MWVLHPVACINQYDITTLRNQNSVGVFTPFGLYTQQDAKPTYKMYKCKPSIQHKKIQKYKRKVTDV
jgi:hypothetical protein